MPRIFSAEGGVAGHHGGEGAERHAVAGKARRDELLLGGFADVGEAVVGFDDLARPAAVDLGLRNDLLEHLAKLREAVFQILFLSGLVVFAAEDGVLALDPVRFAVDSQIVIGVGCVPECGFGQLAAGTVAPTTYEE